MEVQKITVALNSEPPFQRINMRAEDSARTLQVFIVDNDSQPLILTDILAEFRAKRPGGTVISYTDGVTVSDDSNILLGNKPIGAAILEPGIVTCEIILYMENGSFCGTIPFEINAWEPAVRNARINITDDFQSAVEAAIAAQAAAAQTEVFAAETEDAYNKMLEIEHNPVIVGTNGNLWNWDSSQGAYVDSGFPASGGGDMLRSEYDPDSRVAEATDAEGEVPNGIAAYVKQQMQALLLMAHPIGDIYMSAVDVSPAELFGGTWVEWGVGRVPVGVDTSQTEFNIAEKEGGLKTRTLTAQNIPPLTLHGNINKATGGSLYGFNDIDTSSNGFIGNSPLVSYNNSNPQPVSLLQPYITCYMWKRTA